MGLAVSYAADDAALHGVGGGGHHARDDVEDRVPDPTHAVFDVVAEDPEEQHVAANVQQARVEEHRVEHGEKDVLVREDLR